MIDEIHTLKNTFLKESEYLYGHSMFIKGDIVTVIGGNILNTQTETIETNDYVRKYHLYQQTWTDTIYLQSNAFHSACTSNASNKILLFGGKRNGYSNQMIYFDKQHWIVPMEANAKSYAPSARYGHRAVLYKDIMHILGGYDKNGMVDNVLYRRDFDSIRSTSGVWDTCRIDGLPSLYFHTMDLDEKTGKVYIFGGKDGFDTVHGDLYELDLNNHTVTKLDNTTGASPAPRYGHCSFLSENKLYIIGGANKTHGFTDIHIYDLTSNAWSKLGDNLINAKNQLFATAAPSYLGIVYFGGQSKLDPKLFENLSKETASFLLNYADEIALNVAQFLDIKSIGRLRLANKSYVFARVIDCMCHSFLYNRY
jgi:N-acetylneuraminic acid mutarotase